MDSIEKIKESFKIFILDYLRALRTKSNLAALDKIFLSHLVVYWDKELKDFELHKLITDVPINFWDDPWNILILNDDTIFNFIDRVPPEKVYSLINGVFHVVKSLESEGGVKLKYRSTDEPNIDILYVFYASEIEPDINAFLNDIDALELNNKKIRPEKPEEKSQLQNVKLILQPNHKKSRAHQNEIILSSKADNSGKKIKEGNNSFDFIYYLAWLSKKGEPGIEPVQNITNSHLGNIIPEGHISKIFDKNNQYGRFDSGWAWIRGNEAQMNKMKSRINIKLKDKLGITFEIIIKEGIYYSINKNITVELKPYPT